MQATNRYSRRLTMDKLGDEIGQLFMVGIPGPELDRDTADLHRRLPFGGVILFRRNFKDRRTLGRLVRSIHGLRRENPPLVAIDHEGGRVFRLGRPFTHFPSPAEMARRGKQVLRDAATTMARELLEVGIDIDFAPLLDINTNRRNPIIGDRAFGTTARQVADLGTIFFRAMLNEGLIPCGKHFPGHGDTSLDSHLALPRVRRSRLAILRREVVPFKRAVERGIPMIMSAHVLYPALDPKLPATLAPAIMTGLLRQRLGFNGVICTDDLEMKAVSRRYRPQQLSTMAVAAGADLLLFCHSQRKALAAATGLASALRSGKISTDRVEQSLRRLAKCHSLRAA